MKVHSIFAWISLIALATASLNVAARQARSPEFEVASIKPNAAGDHRIAMQTLPGGRINITGATLSDLIRNAYRLQDFQIIGATGWMSSDRWDVQAKADNNVATEQLNEMLQNLLTERFQLKLHRELRKGPVYELVIARNGPKLEEMKPDSNTSGHGSDGHESHGAGSHAGGRGMTMLQLVEMLGNNLGRTVIDKTGLKGNYDIKLSWSPEPGQGSPISNHQSAEARPREAQSSSDPALPSLFTAVQEQLGLKIQSAKGAIEVVVINSAQKPKQ